MRSSDRPDTFKRWEAEYADLQARDADELDELERLDEADRIAGHYPGPPTFPDAHALERARSEADPADPAALEVLARRCS